MDTFRCRTCNRVAVIDYEGECAGCFVDAPSTSPERTFPLTDDELVAQFEADMGGTPAPMGTVETLTESGRTEVTAIFGLLNDVFNVETHEERFDRDAGL